MENPDAEQLLDMALQASQHNDTQKSFGLVKQAIEKSPDDTRMWYMLGSLYADIGIYDKAIENMEKSLQIDPGYGIARFHLGLLFLTMGQQEQAESTWKGLDALGDTHYLTLFKSGLLHIANDQVQDGIMLIEKGINNNQLNEPLNNDMQTVIENASLSLNS